MELPTYEVCTSTSYPGCYFIIPLDSTGLALCCGQVAGVGDGLPFPSTVKNEVQGDHRKSAPALKYCGHPHESFIPSRDKSPTAPAELVLTLNKLADVCLVRLDNNLISFAIAASGKDGVPVFGDLAQVSASRCP